MKYAFDTNIVIHLLIGTDSVRQNRDRARGEGHSYERVYARLLDNCELGEMTLVAWKKAAEIYADLYAKKLTVNDSDIVIAAFCIVNGCTLVTNNTKDFINMDSIKLADWVA